MSARLRLLNPYELHKHLVNEYLLNQPGSTKLLQRDTSKDKTDLDVIRDNHRFLWDDEQADTWEKQLAKKYYDKLFKEYAICDLSRYKENKVALRWRTEKEVVVGKGQFQCGNKRCSNDEGLRSWELNFAYLENKEKKNALVKLRLCADCTEKLNHHSKKREVKRMKKSGKKKGSQRSSAHTGEAERSESKESSDDSKVIGNDASSSGDKDMMTPSGASEDVSSIWQKEPDLEEKSREEEFEEYLEELLL